MLIYSSVVDTFIKIFNYQSKSSDKRAETVVNVFLSYL